MNRRTFLDRIRQTLTAGMAFIVGRKLWQVGGDKVKDYEQEKQYGTLQHPVYNIVNPPLESGVVTFQSFVRAKAPET